MCFIVHTSLDHTQNKDVICLICFRKLPAMEFEVCNPEGSQSNFDSSDIHLVIDV